VVLAHFMKEEGAHHGVVLEHFLKGWGISRCGARTLFEGVGSHQSVVHAHFMKEEGAHHGVVQAHFMKGWGHIRVWCKHTL